MENIAESKEGIKMMETTFLEFLRISIDEKGIHPAPGMFQTPGSDGISIASFLLTPAETLDAVIKICKEQKPIEFIWGLDRFNGPEQGIDEHYKSVFTIYHLKDGKWRTGVFAYNTKDDNYREIDWWNEFWERIQTNELKQMKLI